MSKTQDFHELQIRLMVLLMSGILPYSTSKCLPWELTKLSKAYHVETKKMTMLRTRTTELIPITAPFLECSRLRYLWLQHIKELALASLAKKLMVILMTCHEHKTMSKNVFNECAFASEKLNLKGHSCFVIIIFAIGRTK